MFGPRKRPTSTHAEETSRPSAGSPTRVCTRHSARSGRGLGHAELHHPDPPAGFDHPGQFAHRRRAVVDIAQQVGERQRIELAVGERQPLGFASARRSPGTPAAQARPAGPGAGRASPRSDPAPTTSQPPRCASSKATSPVPGGDIEDALTRAWIDCPHHRPAPARVLAEAEHGAHAGVLRREPGEQLQGVTLARGGGEVWAAAIGA